MKKAIFFAFGLLLAACGEDENSSDCIIKESILRNDTVIKSKNVYVHDGTHYTEMRTYGYNSQSKTYDAEPTVTATFQYAGERISKARYDGPDWSRTYEYSYSGKEAVFAEQHYVEVIQGNTIVDAVDHFHFVESPKDSLYQFDNILEEYKGGNLMRYAYKDPDGDFQAYGFRWRFEVFYKYDNNANAVPEYVFRQEVFAPNWGFVKTMQSKSSINSPVARFPENTPLLSLETGN